MHLRGAIRKSVDAWHVLGGGEHVLLANRADKNKTDTSFIDYEDGNRRMAGKRAQDGVEYSCHILITPPANRQSNPIVLVTGEAGMSRSEVQQLLNFHLRTFSRNRENRHLFLRDDPSAAEGRKKKILVSFELVAHKSLFLEKVLRDGKLEEVDLIETHADALDRNFIQHSKSITIGVAREGASLRMAALTQAIAGAGINPDRMVVRFRDSETNQMKQKSLSFNQLEAALTKTEIITFDTDLMPHYAAPSRKIIEKLLALLN